jgi:uncharacterized protein YggE
VDDDNEAYRDARMAAAADARRRAEAYAAGLGIGLGGASWMSEPGLRLAGGGQTEFFAPAPMQALALSAEQAEPDVIDITPEDVIIRASVEVSFALLDS